MKITVHNIVIDRDKNTKPSDQVWPWVLKVLNEVYPGGLVKVNKVTFVERDSLPDPEAEYSRMETVYGLEEGTNQSFVHIAFGRGKKGIKKLARVINGSVWKDPKAKAPRKPKKVASKKAPVKKAEDDSKNPDF